MRWIKPTLTSIYGLLGQAPAKVDHASDRRFENLRKSMLDLMVHARCDEDHPLVMRRIFYADGIEALWYARSDLHNALCKKRGQIYAQRKVEIISKMFDGLLPMGLVERRSRSRG